MWDSGVRSSVLDCTRRCRLCFGLFLAVIGVGMLSASGPVRAQEAATGTSDVSQLIEDLNDIDTMRPLLSLKLTVAQMDKMIALISETQTGYDKRLKAIAGPALAKMVDQIRVVKQRTLKGEPIPQDFDALAKTAENEILAKRKTLDAETISQMATALAAILSTEQAKLAGKLDRDAQIKLGKADAKTQRTDEQWFASYVRDAFFTVPRIVPVLKQMRAAAGTVADGGGK